MKDHFLLKPIRQWLTSKSGPCSSSLCLIRNGQIDVLGLLQKQGQDSLLMKRTDGLLLNTQKPLSVITSITEIQFLPPTPPFPECHLSLFNLNLEDFHPKAAVRFWDFCLAKMGRALRSPLTDWGGWHQTQPAASPQSWWLQELPRWAELSSSSLSWVHPCPSELDEPLQPSHSWTRLPSGTSHPLHPGKLLPALERAAFLVEMTERSSRVALKLQHQHPHPAAAPGGETPTKSPNAKPEIQKIRIGGRQFLKAAETKVQNLCWEP